MTGPEHYREAERILGLIAETPEDSVGSVAAAATAAHAHATLALAAATALENYHGSGMTEGDHLAWYRAASAHPEHHRLQREAKAAEFAEFTEAQS